MRKVFYSHHNRCLRGPCILGNRCNITLFTLLFSLLSQPNMLKVLVSVNWVRLVLACARKSSASAKNVEVWSRMVIVGWLHLYAIAKSLLIDSRLQLNLFVFKLWLVLRWHHVHIFPELLLIASLCIFVGRIRLLNRRVSVKCLFPLFLGNIWNCNVLKSWDLSTACEDGLDLSVNLLSVALTFLLNLQNFVAI